MKLDDALRGVTRLGIDTAPIIYFVETHPRYIALVDDDFQRIAAGRCEAITSVITLKSWLTWRGGRRSPGAPTVGSFSARRRISIGPPTRLST